MKLAMPKERKNNEIKIENDNITGYSVVCDNNTSVSASPSCISPSPTNGAALTFLSNDMSPTTCASPPNPAPHKAKTLHVSVNAIKDLFSDKNTVIAVFLNKRYVEDDLQALCKLAEDAIYSTKITLRHILRFNFRRQSRFTNHILRILLDLREILEFRSATTCNERQFFDKLMELKELVEVVDALIAMTLSFIDYCETVQVEYARIYKSFFRSASLSLQNFAEKVLISKLDEKAKECERLLRVISEFTASEKPPPSSHPSNFPFITPSIIAPSAPPSFPVR